MTGETASQVAARSRTDAGERGKVKSSRPVAVKVDVCICTHNPDYNVLRLVIAALAAQSADVKSYRVTIIDNASTPPIPESVLEPLEARGVNSRIIREEKLGIAQARLRAAHEADADWLCFIDDDNVVTQTYIEVGEAYAANNPHVGAFGGRLLMPPTIPVRHHIKPFLPYLGIKDLGDVALAGPSTAWCEWEPPTAGSFVSRQVMNAFVLAVERESNVLGLGRRGLNSSVSCEDSFIMRGAHGVGKSLAYVPQLILYHHLRLNRLRLGYLLKLLYGYGKSHVLLERCLNPALQTPHYYKDFGALIATLQSQVPIEAGKSLAFAVGMAGYHIASWRAYREPI